MAQIATTIEQSKKLIELGIDVNTADMHYSKWDNEEEEEYHLKCGGLPKLDFKYAKNIPAWSLSALINLLPSKLTEKDKHCETTYKIDVRKYALTEDVDVYQIAYGYWKIYEGGNSSWRDRVNTGQKENLIDAAFEMVCYLLENKMI